MNNSCDLQNYGRKQQLLFLPKKGFLNRIFNKLSTLLQLFTSLKYDNNFEILHYLPTNNSLKRHV